MKVLIGVHHFPPRYLGGAELVAKRCAAGLQARGHEVQVVCVERIDEGPAEGLAWSDESYEGLHLRRLFFDLRRAPDPFLWAYDNPWIGRHFAALLEEAEPDVFLLIGGYLLSASPVAAARARGVPVVWRLTDFWTLCPRATLWRSDGGLSSLPIDPVTCARCLGEERRRYRLSGRVAPPLMKLFWRLRRRQVARVRRRLEFLLQELASADVVLCPSEVLCHAIAAAGIDGRRVHLLRQGVEPPAALPRSTADHLRLGYLGLLSPSKGADVLLRAVRALPDARLSVVLYGDVSAFPRYTARLHALARGDPRIEFRGRYQEWGGLARVLSEIDAVVAPFMAYENSPNVILEAFAHGVPVLTSDLGSMRELVRHDESGLLFRPGDAASLAVQIGRLTAEPSLLDVLRAGVPPVKTADEEVDEFEAWCRRAAQRRLAPPLKAQA